MNIDQRDVFSMGKRLKDIEDRLIENADIGAKTKAKLVFDLSIHKRQGSRMIVATAVATIAAAAAALLIISSDYRTITAEADGKPIQTGAWISTLRDKNCELSFSEGSSVILTASSGLRLRNLSKEGAHLLLERGSIKAEVVHHKKTDWKFDVGPYIIKVVGTSFNVSWNPEVEELKLEMIEGEVLVNGPMISSHIITKGETLLASPSDRFVKIVQSDALARIEKEISKPRQLLTEQTDTIVLEETQKKETSSSTKSLSDESTKETRRNSLSALNIWKELADSGRFSDAVNTAKKEGLINIFKTAPASDLLLLGDAARHTKDLQIATDAYKAVRKRYPNSAHSASAAFALGLVAFDGQKNYVSASKWFAACLADRKHGSLSKEALGRLMESHQLAGNREEAEKTADKYLQEYPNGPHAAMARRLTE